jgi:hypothetical protein
VVATDSEQRGSASMGAEQCEGGRERGGNPPLCMRDQIRSTPTWALATTGGDRHQHTLHRERGHHAVTRSVVSGTGAVTGPRG